MQETKVGTASMSYNDALCEFHSFVYFKEMTTTLQIKEKKHIERNFPLALMLILFSWKLSGGIKCLMKSDHGQPNWEKITRGNNAKNYTASL